MDLFLFRVRENAPYFFLRHTDAIVLYAQHHRIVFKHTFDYNAAVPLLYWDYVLALGLNLICILKFALISYDRYTSDFILSIPKI